MEGNNWGWDIGDWEDLAEETMVTPDTGLPPAEPWWAAKYETDTSRENETPLAENRSGAACDVRSVDRLGSEDQQRPSNLWGGFNSLFAAATSFTTTVGEGFTNVLETVETSLGAPTPEDLARLSLAERAELRKKADEVKEPWPQEDRDDCDSAEEIMSDGGSETGAGQSEEGSSGYQSDSGKCREIDSSKPVRPSGFTGLISGVTTAFESTSKTLVSGSLDVLETLGKKTFDALTETDRETQRKRFFLTAEKPNLSMVLRELKEKGEADTKSFSEEQERRRSNYAALFEEFQGFINLEALEMLSENCSQRLEIILKSENSKQQLRDSLEAIRTSFEYLDDISLSFSEEEEEGHNFQVLLRTEMQRLNISFNSSKIFEVHQRRWLWMEKSLKEQNLGERKEGKEIYLESIESLAELTACCMELFLKLGQLLLLDKSSPDPESFIE